MIPFSIEEQVFVARTDVAETFEEVCEIAVDVYNFSKQEKVQEPAPQEMPAAEQQEGESEESVDEQSEQQEQQTSEVPGPSDQQQQQQEEETFDIDEPGDEGSETQRAFDNAAEKLTDRFAGNPVYVEIPESVDLPTYIADWTEVHDWIDECRNNFLAGGDGICLLYTSPSPRDS